MGDGHFGADEATPDAGSGPSRASGLDGDDVGLIGTRGAAPWERFGAPTKAVAVAHRRSAPPVSVPPAVETAADHDRDHDHDTGGCHTNGGLTVADLIAKVGGAATNRPTHHHAAVDFEQPDPDLEQPDDGYDAYAASTSAAYPFDLPELALREPQWGTDRSTELPVEQTTVLPKTLAPARAEEIVGDDADDEYPETPVKKSHRKRRALLIGGRFVAAAVAATALAMTGGAWQWTTSKNHRLNTVSALDPHSQDIVDANAQYGDEDFLIVGMDSRAGANSNMGAGDTEDAGGTRSDTIMLVNIPANRKRVVSVSFPRDLAITPIQCEAWNPDTGEYGPLYDSDTKKWG
ncbi:MAG TPA: LytR family transcriptional regulator, partial [Mycobacterium sp.]